MHNFSPVKRNQHYTFIKLILIKMAESNKKKKTLLFLSYLLQNLIRVLTFHMLFVCTDIKKFKFAVTNHAFFWEKIGILSWIIWIAGATWIDTIPRWVLIAIHCCQPFQSTQLNFWFWFAPQKSVQCLTFNVNDKKMLPLLCIRSKTELIWKPYNS